MAGETALQKALFILITPCTLKLHYISGEGFRVWRELGIENKKNQLNPTSISLPGGSEGGNWRKDEFYFHVKPRFEFGIIFLLFLFSQLASAHLYKKKETSLPL